MGRDSWLRWPGCSLLLLILLASLGTAEREVSCAAVGQQRCILIAFSFFKVIVINRKLSYSLIFFSQSGINFEKHKSKGRPQTTAIFPFFFARSKDQSFCEKKRVPKRIAWVPLESPAHPNRVSRRKRGPPYEEESHHCMNPIFFVAEKVVGAVFKVHKEGRKQAVLT